MRRERRVLVDRDGPLAEVVVDRVTAQRDGASATFEEVELEAHRDESALRALVERLRQDLDLSPDPGIDALIPDTSSEPMDVQPIIRQLVDDGRFLEVHAGWAGNTVTIT